ncbi:hypothetical protein SDC9_120137 [bioreactor metagenome]|uniref:Uncharacterized protein n=1 Tax=bioreactor metagenome TaxID=1076179 RepID=A0A645C7U4_9ZZZZ
MWQSQCTHGIARQQHAKQQHRIGRQRTPAKRSQCRIGMICSLRSPAPAARRQEQHDHHQCTQRACGRRAKRKIGRRHRYREQQPRQCTLKHSTHPPTRIACQPRRGHTGDHEGNHAHACRCHAQRVERQPRHGGGDQRSRPHRPPGHGAQAQQPDQRHLARRKPTVQQQRNTHRKADAEARERFGKRRRAMHDQQHRANAAARVAQHPLRQRLLRPGHAQHFGKQQAAAHDQQYLDQHRQPQHQRLHRSVRRHRKRQSHTRRRQHHADPCRMQ